MGEDKWGGGGVERFVKSSGATKRLHTKIVLLLVLACIVYYHTQSCDSCSVVIPQLESQRLLMLHGVQGSGKTLLAKSLAEHLKVFHNTTLREFIQTVG